MKGILLVMLLMTTVFSDAQPPTFHELSIMRAHKVNRFIDTVTRKIYDIKTIDSLLKAGIGIGLARDSTIHDTAYWLFFFLKPFVQDQTDLYKRMMGQQFPSFVMEDLRGQDVNGESFKGKIVLFNFWSTSCAPCVAEIPILNRLADSLKNGPFVFVAAAMEESSEVVRFLKVHPFNYVVLPGAKAFNSAMGVTIYPTNIVIDKNGKVVSVLEGINIDSVSHQLLIREEIDSVIKKVGSVSN